MTSGLEKSHKKVEPSRMPADSSNMQPLELSEMVLLFSLVLAIGIVGMLALLRHQPMDPNELILRSVRVSMMQKHGWDEERADAVEAEYIRFWRLLQLKTDFNPIPWRDAQGRDDLEQFWKQHILDTEKYELDCKSVFGRIIHHNPHLVPGSPAEMDAVAHTLRLYEQTFHESPYDELEDEQPEQPEELTSEQRAQLLRSMTPKPEPQEAEAQKA